MSIKDNPTPCVRCHELDPKIAELLQKIEEQNQLIRDLWNALMKHNGAGW